LGGLEGLRGARRGPQHSPKKDALRLPAEPQRPGGSEMTAEVAILNKIGVALAADSIVTITTANGDKTYNTANKLFALSKYPSHRDSDLEFYGLQHHSLGSHYKRVSDSIRKKKLRDRSGLFERFHALSEN
jgi:hypothetical protein